MKPVDQLMQSVAWEPTDAKPGTDGLPYATHSGALDLFGTQIRCYRLNTGEAILNAEDVQKFFGFGFDMGDAA